MTANGVCKYSQLFLYLHTHTNIFKRKMFPYPIASRMPQLKTQQRKMNIATQKGCILYRIVAYLFSNSSLPQNERDPTVISFVHIHKKKSKSEALATISFRIQSPILFLTKCSYNGKNTYWRILLKTQSTHTQNRVLRGSMEETLEAGRTLSLSCSDS